MGGRGGLKEGEAAFQVRVDSPLLECGPWRHNAALGKAAGGGHGRLNCLSLPKPVSRERGRWAQGISA